ncbi:hypothetical protein K469DRAFT_739491 [Zopfia rhizophila CBS 207.26]|uniref:Uncharacterized protein n=1 Tax=Zopfia rhizophila CBS 207.26 TaxID=1314779 RepID=A0A6A6DZR2_9PEZI|nr:hypothetical protein K469DRAFT_739491 [Zopfia rhizophila CBS 207.26]
MKTDTEIQEPRPNPQHRKREFIVSERPLQTPQTNRALRKSTEPGDPGLDLFDVNGTFFPAGLLPPHPRHQIQLYPALDLADAKTTREIIDLKFKYGGHQTELYKHLKTKRNIDLHKARDQVCNTHLEATRQYSQTACLLGIIETRRRLYDETVRLEDGDDILHRWLQNFHKEHDAGYLFQVQLLENLEDQPLGFESFRPLGGSNRLRRIVMYPKPSAPRREMIQMNGREEIHLTYIDEIPDGEANKGSARF